MNMNQLAIKLEDDNLKDKTKADLISFSEGNISQRQPLSPQIYFQLKECGLETDKFLKELSFWADFYGFHNTSYGCSVLLGDEKAMKKYSDLEKQSESTFSSIKDSSKLIDEIHALDDKHGELMIKGNKRGPPYRAVSSWMHERDGILPSVRSPEFVNQIIKDPFYLNKYETLLEASINSRLEGKEDYFIDFMGSDQTFLDGVCVFDDPSHLISLSKKINNKSGEMILKSREGLKETFDSTLPLEERALPFLEHVTNLVSNSRYLNLAHNKINNYNGFQSSPSSC